MDLGGASDVVLILPEFLFLVAKGRIGKDHVGAIPFPDSDSLN
jgi:hypothetical protein